MFKVKLAKFSRSIGPLVVATAIASSGSGVAVARVGAPPGAVVQESSQSELDQYVEKQVGRFGLVKANHDEGYASANAANDSVVMAYKGDNGDAIDHAMLGYSSPNEARHFQQGTVDELKKDGYRIVAEKPIKSADDKEVGTVVVLRGQDEVTIWTIEHLAALANGDTEDAVEFYNERIAMGYQIQRR